LAEFNLQMNELTSKNLISTKEGFNHDHKGVLVNVENKNRTNALS